LYSMSFLSIKILIKLIVKVVWIVIEWDLGQRII
jgi:hypothetical protein